MQTRSRALAVMLVPISAAVLAALVSLPGPAQTRTQSKGQLQTQPALKDGCRLVVPAKQSVLQPKRLRPSQVQSKNAMGCLSPADAIYGANGCPLRLCGPNAGVIQLPGP
jgi:hypothetical protein